MTQTPNFIARSGIAHMTCDTGYKFCDLLPLAFCDLLVAIGIVTRAVDCYECTTRIAMIFSGITLYYGSSYIVLSQYLAVLILILA